MKVGHALRKERGVHGNIYRITPPKARNIKGDDLNRCIGTVLQNDTVNRILTVQVTLMDRFASPREESLVAQIHYLAMQRVRLISAVTYAARPENPNWPTAHGIGTEFYPYKTSVDVALPPY